MFAKGANPAPLRQTRQTSPTNLSCLEKGKRKSYFLTPLRNECKFGMLRYVRWATTVCPVMNSSRTWPIACFLLVDMGQVYFFENSEMHLNRSLAKCKMTNGRTLSGTFCFVRANILLSAY